MMGLQVRQTERLKSIFRFTAYSFEGEGVGVLFLTDIFSILAVFITLLSIVRSMAKNILNNR